MDDANLVCVLCFFLLNTRQGRMEWNLVLTFISSLGVFRHPKVAYPVGKDEVKSGMGGSAGSQSTSEWQDEVFSKVLWLF